MKEFWNSRYSEEGFAYGDKPNVFLAAELTKMPVGKLLLPAEGEGRNAIFAAKMGWQVTAIDQSDAGQYKALAWAKKERVGLDYQVGDLATLDLGTNTFDAAALIFAHFPPTLKTLIHHKVANALKPGGMVILEGFSKGHLAYNTTNPQAGGPRDEALLYSTQEIADLFPGFKTILLEEKTVELREGKYHVGKSAVVRYVGKRK